MPAWTVLHAGRVGAGLEVGLPLRPIGQELALQRGIGGIASPYGSISRTPSTPVRYCASTQAASGFWLPAKIE